jgi:hypothetical protein
MGCRFLPIVILILLAASAGSSAYDGAGKTDHSGNDLQGIIAFYGIYHDVNKLLLHVSNVAMFGDAGGDPRAPSAEWPAGAGIEYLYAAGLWVGGVVMRDDKPDTCVTAAVFQGEFRPKADDRDMVYAAFEGMSGGGRLIDDDGDGAVDEDNLDGYDNDSDGLIDEDFAAISQQMFTSAFFDTSVIMNQARTEDFHKPLNLAVRQESYAWTTPQIEDFIGIEYRVSNCGELPVEKAYIGFMVDADIGPARGIPGYYLDDMVSYVDTVVTRTELTHLGEIITTDYHITMGYMYDYKGGNDGQVPGYIGIMFLGHTTDPAGTMAPEQVEIHSFRRWSGGALDPENDRERYRYMKGISDHAKTIDPPTDKEKDYRFLVSAGPFISIPAGSTLVFQVAFVMGDPFADLIDNAANALKVYNGGTVRTVQGDQYHLHWLGPSPPPPPGQQLLPGDGKVIIEWDDYSERVPDPLQQTYDFAGYRIWKANGWRRESEVPSSGQWMLLADISKTDLFRYDTGLMDVGKYRYVDEYVHNGLPYWYAVTAYDDGTAEMTLDPVTGQRVPVPRYGSYAQSMQLVYPRSTPARVCGRVRVVPNPYPGLHERAKRTGRAIGDMVEYERDPSGRRVRFLNLPRRSTVRIYTLAGDLVWMGYFEDPTDASREPPGWNLVTRNNQEAVSGLYILHVDSPRGSELTRFVIVR